VLLTLLVLLFSPSRRRRRVGRFRREEEEEEEEEEEDNNNNENEELVENSWKFDVNKKAARRFKVGTTVIQTIQTKTERRRRKNECW
jgi:hypothetical protein